MLLSAVHGWYVWWMSEAAQCVGWVECPVPHTTRGHHPLHPFPPLALYAGPVGVGLGDLGVAVLCRACMSEAAQCGGWMACLEPHTTASVPTSCQEGGVMGPRRSAG